MKAAILLLPVLIAAATVTDTDLDRPDIVNRTPGQFIDAAIVLDQDLGQVATVAVDLRWSDQFLEFTEMTLMEPHAGTADVRTDGPIDRATLTITPGDDGGPALCVMRFRCVAPTYTLDANGKRVYGPVALPVTRFEVVYDDRALEKLEPVNVDKVQVNRGPARGGLILAE